MKKGLLLIVICFLFISLVSCNDTFAKEGSVTMTLTSEWKDVITYNTSAPSRTFSFDGTFNVYETSSELGYVFTKNDNYLLSDALAKHFVEVVGENKIIVKSTIQSADEKGALFGKDKLSLDEGTVSKEEAIVTWDENGTRYSYLYRTFIHGGKTYYAYTYNTGITMSIEVPLICQVVDGKQQVYMLSLPYDTKYQLNINTKVKSLKNKAEYTEKKYHTFEYPAYASFLEGDNVSVVKAWYQNYCDGREVDGAFVFTYLGVDFVATFEEAAFIIDVK